MSAVPLPVRELDQLYSDSPGPQKDLDADGNGHVPSVSTTVEDGNSHPSAPDKPPQLASTITKLQVPAIVAAESDGTKAVVCVGGGDQPQLVQRTRATLQVASPAGEPAQLQAAADIAAGAAPPPPTNDPLQRLQARAIIAIPHTAAVPGRAQTLRIVNNGPLARPQPLFTIKAAPTNKGSAGRGGVVAGVGGGRMARTVLPLPVAHLQGAIHRSRAVVTRPPLPRKPLAVSIGQADGLDQVKVETREVRVAHAWGQAGQHVGSNANAESDDDKLASLAAPVPQIRGRWGGRRGGRPPGRGRGRSRGGRPSNRGRGRGSRGRRDKKLRFDAPTTSLESDSEPNVGSPHDGDVPNPMDDDLGTQGDAESLEPGAALVPGDQDLDDEDDEDDDADEDDEEVGLAPTLADFEGGKTGVKNDEDVGDDTSDGVPREVQAPTRGRGRRGGRPRTRPMGPAAVVNTNLGLESAQSGGIPTYGGLTTEEKIATAWQALKQRDRGLHVTAMRMHRKLMSFCNYKNGVYRFGRGRPPDDMRDKRKLLVQKLKFLLFPEFAPKEAVEILQDSADLGLSGSDDRGTDFRPNNAARHTTLSALRLRERRSPPRLRPRGVTGYDGSSPKRSRLGINSYVGRNHDSGVFETNAMLFNGGGAKMFRGEGLSEFVFEVDYGMVISVSQDPPGARVDGGGDNPETWWDVRPIGSQFRDADRAFREGSEPAQGSQPVARYITAGSSGGKGKSLLARARVSLDRAGARTMGSNSGGTAGGRGGFIPPHSQPPPQQQPRQQQPPANSSQQTASVIKQEHPDPPSLAEVVVKSHTETLPQNTMAIVAPPRGPYPAAPSPAIPARVTPATRRSRDGGGVGGTGSKQLGELLRLGRDLCSKEGHGDPGERLGKILSLLETAVRKGQAAEQACDAWRGYGLQLQHGLVDLMEGAAGQWFPGGVK